MKSMKSKNWRQISPLSLIIVPLKQHLGCCVILPLLLKIFAATALAEFVYQLPYAELLLGLFLLPAVIYMCLKLEDWWKLRAHRQKSSCQLGCCPEKPDLGHFTRRFALNLVLGAIIMFSVHYLFHDQEQGQIVEISQDYHK